MIILKVTYHTAHTATQNTRTKGKKLVEKERQQKKAKYISIKQWKPEKNIVLINLQLIFIDKNRLDKPLRKS